MNVSFELRIGSTVIPVFIHGFTNPAIDNGEIYWPWLGALARRKGENQPMWEERLKRDVPGFEVDGVWYPGCSVCGRGGCAGGADIDVRFYLRGGILAPFCDEHRQPGDVLVEFGRIDLERDRTPTQVAQDVDEMTHLRVINYHDQHYSQRNIASMIDVAQTTVGYHIRRHRDKKCRCFPN